MESPLFAFMFAMMPFVLVALVWRSVASRLAHVEGAVDRSGDWATVYAGRGWRMGGVIVLVVLVLFSIVGSMSSLAAATLGAGGLLAGAVVLLRGAFDPHIDVHSQEFDERLRGFLDDAA